jgi:heme A synthase
VRIGVMAVNLLLVLQVAAGALVVELGLPAWIRGLHIALASLLWGSVVAVAVLITQAAGEVSTAPASQRSEGIRPQAKAASL